MNDWLSPQEREEFRAYNEKRYKEQHGACLERINQLRQELSLAEEGLANYQQENANLHSILARRLQELDDAKWLIRNGEKHFGSLWRDATSEDINAITRRALPQSAEQQLNTPKIVDG